MVTRGKSNSALAWSVDLAYVAGLFDGEGSISIGRSKPYGAMRTRSYTATVSIGSTYFPILEWLQEHFGGSVYDCKPTRAHYKPFRRWEVSSLKARDFLRDMLPYLRIKRDLAVVLIAFVDGRESGRPLPGQIGRARQVSPEQLAWREEMYWKVRALNGHPQRLTEAASRTDEVIV